MTKNRHYIKEDARMADKHMNRCSTSFAFRRTQIKITMKFQFRH